MKPQKKKVWHSAFADSISHEKVGRMINDQAFGNFNLDEDTSSRYHFTLFKLAVLLIAFLFVGRLFQLTVVFGSENKQLSENNRIKLIQRQPLRGRILDRNGIVLVQSVEDLTLKKGSETTKITGQQAEDLQKQGLASEDFEGELGKIERQIKREYLLGEAGSHVFGYLSLFQGDSEETRNGYSAGDLIGRSGLESSYDNFLKGKKGKRIIEVDALGKKVSILGEEAPISGSDVKSTIDSGLQKVAYEALKRQAEKVKSFRGAVVIQDPNSGQILGLVSVPGYDPADVGKYFSASDKPFFNRAIQGNYPPGSVFKIVSALAGLESGKINKDTEIEDEGEITVGGVKFSNWYFTSYGGRDGQVKIEKAIARSNDIYFYRLAEKLGLQSIRKMALKFGFGQKTGVDLPGEAFGLVPDEVWKKSVLNEQWFLGDTLHLGIGQGFMLATPMQISTLSGYMAVGREYKPYLVTQVGKGQEAITIGSKLVGENLVGRENFDLVRSGMRQACSKGGTAFPFFDSPYSVGCKTGTAEKTEGNPNAWFTVFAPFEKPEITVTVVIEDGGEGSVVAAPVAREILDWFFAHKR